jgi:hypothetical protein
LKLDPENPIAWYGRGISHLQIKYLIGACEDLNRALELGYTFARDLIHETLQIEIPRLPAPKNSIKQKQGFQA